MPFQKGHKKGAKKCLKYPTDKTPLCFVTWEGDKERLMKIPGWQDKLRDYVRELVEEN